MQLARCIVVLGMPAYNAGYLFCNNIITLDRERYYFYYLYKFIYIFIYLCVYTYMLFSFIFELRKDAKSTNDNKNWFHSPNAQRILGFNEFYSTARSRLTRQIIYLHVGIGITSVVKEFLRVGKKT